MFDESDVKVTSRSKVFDTREKTNLFHHMHLSFSSTFSRTPKAIGLSRSAYTFALQWIRTAAGV